MEEKVEPVEEKAFYALRDIFDLLTGVGVEKSRELSLALTKLEETMMWLNKDRTIKGQLPVLETHVHQPR